MTRTPSQLRQINPISQRAEVRRTEWELEATQKAGFWRQKRWDNIDLLLAVFILSSAAMALWGFFS